MANKRYDYTLTLGANDAAVNQVMALLQKNLIKATKKENVINITAEYGDVKKAMKEISEMDPKIGASIQIELDKTELNQQIKFLNDILNSEVEIDKDQIASKFKSAFTSGIKDLKLGDILTSEVEDSTRSIENVQKAVNKVFERISGVDISKSLDFSEMTKFVQDLEIADKLIKEISSQKKLQKVDLSGLQGLVDSNKIKSTYKQIGDLVLMNNEALLSNLETTYLNAFKKMQEELQGMLKSGTGTGTGNGYGNGISKELEEAESKLALMEKGFESTKKSAKELEKTLLSLAAQIDEAFEFPELAEQIPGLQKELVDAVGAYKEVAGIDLFNLSPNDEEYEKFKKVINELEDLPDDLANYRFEPVTEESLNKQRALIKELKEGTSGGSGGTGGTKIGVTPDIDPAEFAKKVSEQLTVPAQIEVEGKVSDPQEFARDVSQYVDYIPVDITFGEISDEEIDEFKKKIQAVMPLLAVNIPVSFGADTETDNNGKQKVDVGVNPVVENPETFAKEVSKQLTAPAEILVEGKVSAKKFTQDITEKLANSVVKVPVELGKISKENSLSKLPSKIEIKPKITSAKAFADSVTKQAKVPAEIAVKPDAASLKTYKSIISALAQEAQNTSTKTSKSNISKKVDSRKEDLSDIKNELSEIGKLTPEIQKKISNLQKSIARISTASGLKKFDEQFKSLEADAEKLVKEFEDATDANQTLSKTFKSLNKNAKQYANLQSKLTLTGSLTEQETRDLEALKAEYDDVTNETEEFRIATDASTESIEKATTARKEYLETFNDTYVANVNKAFSNYAKKIDDLGTSKNIDKDELERIKKLIDEINTNPIDVVTEEGRNKVADYSKRIQDFFDKVSEQAKEVSVQRVSNEISQFLKKNTALSLEFRMELDKLSKKLNSDLTADELKEIYTDLLKIEQAAEQAGQTGKNSLDVISGRLSDMDAKFLAQILSWQDIIRYIREVASEVIKLDTALTEMRKVSDESLESLKQYQNLSFDIADSIGVTAEQLQESTADFMRLGESLTDASESARVANVLMNVSEFESIDEATDSLIAMAAAYSDLEKMDIVDKLNEIGNNYSISTDGIATALQDSASALVTAYNDIDEAIALITAGNVVTQDPAKVGNGLRTIALRLTGTKEASEALQELGEETDGMITTQAKLRETIMDATKAASANGEGFDILDKNGNYKSTYEIMLGLAELYDEIAKKDKELGTNNLNLLLETIAGKTRANIAASILQNPDILKNAFNDSAINATNSALEENQKYLESIQGHIEKFRNAVQQLFHYLLETGTINKVIDFATEFINKLTEIVKVLGSTGSLFATGGLVLFLKNFGSIVNNLINILPALTEGTMSFGTALTKIFPSLTKIITAVGTLGSKLAAFAATPVGVTILAISTALYAGYKAWDYFTVTVEEATEELEEFESKYSGLRDEIEDHKKVVDECAASYEELAKGVDTLTNKNLTLSDDDYQEYLDITNQLAETFPQIIKKADEYGGTILTIGENWETATEALKAYISEEEKAYLYERYSDLKKYTEDSKVTLGALEKEKETTQEEIELLNKQIASTALLKRALNEVNSGEVVDLSAMFEQVGYTADEASNLIEELREYFGLYGTLEMTNGQWLLDLSTITEEDKRSIEEYCEGLITQYQTSLKKASVKLNTANTKFESQFIGLRSVINDSLQFLLSGDEVEPDTREIAEKYVSSLTSDMLDQFRNEKGEIDYEVIEELLEKWSYELQQLEPEQKADFLKLFDTEVSPQEKVQIYNKLKAIFEDMGIEIPIDFLIEDEQDVLGRLKTRIGELSKLNVDNNTNPSDPQFIKDQIQETENAQRAFDELFDELEINTVEEYNKILDIIKGCETWEEAVQKVRDAYAAASQELDSFDYNSLEDAISDVNTKLLPQFEKLGELYDEIFNGDNGFDLSGIGSSDLQSVVETFEKIDAALQIDPPTEAVQEFINVIGNPSSTATQVQESFDAIATAYFNAAVSANNFSEENAVVLEQMLKEMGIVNADEVVDYYTTLAEAQKLVADNGWNLVEADKAMIDGWVEAVGASEETANALYILALKQIFLNENWVNEENSIAQVLALADAAGIATEAVGKLGDAQANISSLLADLKATNDPLKQAEIANSIKEAREDAKAYAEEIQDEVNNFSIDFSHVGSSSGSNGSAGSAGKDAADEYVEAFEEELEALEKQRDAGIISEKEFLEKYKNLIERYFKDVDGYAEEYAERMHDYFDRLTSYYENVFSAIGTILSHRISALEKAKSAAVASINAEKEAAAASYQAQIDYIDGLIDAKEAEIDAIDKEIDRYQDQIDAIDKQIDALEEANQKRQQAINLQKAQYELEKAQNQRTKLIYKGGQLVYENDTSAVRDAKENLEDAEFEIQKQKLEDLKKPLEEQIELLEKRKELIQDEIDGLQKQQEAIQKAMEASNKYYEQMIKETEAYWDALIEKLEDTKSKFEQIAELRDLAEAIDLINSYLGDTKYTIEDVWNGSPELIDQMLQDFIDALMGANSANEDFKNSLALAAQEMGLSFDQISQDAKDTENNLNPLADALSPLTQASVEIGDTADALGKVAENSEKVATHTGTASTNSSDLATSLDEIAETSPDAARGLDETATNIQKEGDAAKEAAPHKEAFAKANEKIAENAEKVATNVGKAAEAIGEEGTNAENAYQSLNNLSNVNLASIVTQTTLLAEAIGDVATALGLTADQPISAIETAITNLSQMTLGEESTGIIGSFNSLKTAVEGVTSAIGSGGGASSGEADMEAKSAGMDEGANDGGSGGLIGAIGELHTATDENIGTSAEDEGSEEGGTVISDFNALKAAVNLVAEAIGIPGENGDVAEESLLGVIKTMPELSEEPIMTTKGFFDELESAIQRCVAAVGDLISSIGKLGASLSGAGLTAADIGFATGNVHIGEATGNVHAGNAYASGKLGIKKSENALVGEIGRELVYNPTTGTYRTVGDHGPEITRLNKGDLIFNAEQTKAIIKHGKRDHGHSYAGGNSEFMPLTSAEIEMFKKMGSAVEGIKADVDQMLEPVKSLTRGATYNTTNNNPVINISDTHFDVQGVTGEQVARQISDTFEGLISHAYQRAMKK